MKRVLVAPLDWGLGHATRCIPIIEALQKRRVEIFIASSGSALALLRKEFPALTFFSLPSYRVRYPNRGSFVFSMFLQIPKISAAISREHEQMDKLVADSKIDLIISDNRYGCWSSSIPSVFIGHQLNIQLPSTWRILKPTFDWLHKRMIRKFDQCWVPDETQINLTGDLSQLSSLEIRKIGILSRFQKRVDQKKYDIAFVLSGPEPQRTIFEKIVVRECMKFSQLSIIIVRGVVEGEGNWRQDGNLTTVNFLTSSKLEEVINQSKLVIARSGYSTIMDLYRLGKKAVFVPTPGQTEQEYLGRKLMKEKVALCVDQGQFSLEQALGLTQDYSGFVDTSEGNILDEALDSMNL